MKDKPQGALHQAQEATTNTDPLLPTTRQWKAKYTLKSHYDAVRDIAFHPTLPAMVTVSEDATAKLWNITGATVTPGAASVHSKGGRRSGKRPSAPKTVPVPMEPVFTYRGHTASLQACLVVPLSWHTLSLPQPHPRAEASEDDDEDPAARFTMVTAGSDTTLRLWRSFALTRAPYAPYHSVRGCCGVLRGHTDTVHVLAYVTVRRDGGAVVWVVSGSADATLRVWAPWEGARATGTSPTPVRVVPCHVPPTALTPLPHGTTGGAGASTTVLAVAYRDASVRLVDVATGRTTHHLADPFATYDGTVATQINACLAYTTEPPSEDGTVDGTGGTEDDGPRAAARVWVVTGHEDRSIRVYDVATGTCVHTMVAHLDAVAALAAYPPPDTPSAARTLVSVGHDASVRFWARAAGSASAEAYRCVQEITAHRLKYDEAMHAIRVHPRFPLLATAGADATVKLYV